MVNSQSGIPNSQPVSTNVHQGANIDEDEINLMDYFRVLWKRKNFILLVSILPALIVGLILFFWPRKFKVTYVYDVRDRSMYDVSNWNLDEKNYNVFLNRFYSEENIGKIVNKLRENGLDRHAELMSRARRRGELKKFVDFEVLPPYTDVSKARVTDPEKLEQIRQLEAQLLSMIIVARPKKDIPIIASVVRDNLEKVIPVYLVEERLHEAAREFRAKMADIEENRFNLELALKTNESILGKLKNIKTRASDKGEGNITLQFDDVGGRSEYLPLGYQIQAAESKIVELEGKVIANEEKYNHYKDLLPLNEKLLAELKNNTSIYYTIQQFHSFLIGLVDSDRKKELKDHLNSYIKKTENRISASAPVTEKPRVYVVSKGVGKKSAIVFAISLMISIFAAFLSEGIQKSQANTS